MKEVLYLCFVNSKEKNGFVFPNEIDDKNYYSPGIFIIEGKSYYKLDNKYNFRAFQNKDIKSYPLEKMRKNIYRVRIENKIDLYFKAKFISTFYNNYFGNQSNRFDKNNFFYELIPIQPNQLEDLCKTKNFFFVGAVE